MKKSIRSGASGKRKPGADRQLFSGLWGLGSRRRADRRSFFGWPALALACLLLVNLPTAMSWGNWPKPIGNPNLALFFNLEKGLTQLQETKGMANDSRMAMTTMFQRLRHMIRDQAGMQPIQESDTTLSGTDAIASFSGGGSAFLTKLSELGCHGALFLYEKPGNWILMVAGSFSADDLGQLLPDGEKLHRPGGFAFPARTGGDLNQPIRGENPPRRPSVATPPREGTSSTPPQEENSANISPEGSSNHFGEAARIDARTRGGSILNVRNGLLFICPVAMEGNHLDAMERELIVDKRWDLFGQMLKLKPLLAFIADTQALGELWERDERAIPAGLKSIKLIRLLLAANCQKLQLYIPEDESRKNLAGSLSRLQTVLGSSSFKLGEPDIPAFREVKSILQPWIQTPFEEKGTSLFLENSAARPRANGAIPQQ